MGPKNEKKLGIDHNDYHELSVSYVLANCEDVKEEKGAMEKLVTSKGHIVIFSPKDHPEITGAGIEYDWGFSKKIFRKENDHKPKYYERDVRSFLQRIILTIAYHTSRKVRLYMKVYASDSGESQVLIEKYVKLHKCHRNILDQETSYLESLRLQLKGYIQEMKHEKDSILKERREVKSEIKIQYEKIEYKKNESE